MVAVSEEELTSARHKMVTEQLAPRGIKDARVLAAMERVPRHRFLPPEQWAVAYEDKPQPIGQGQTISQPYMVARMSELCLLRGGERVLEIGAGSGYQTAVLAELVGGGSGGGKKGEVWAVERLPALAQRCEARMQELGYRNVKVAAFDGTLGWPEGAPWDAILCAAGAPRVPALLLAELAEGGRLIIPVGDREEQRLAVITRHGDEFETHWDTACRFVDLIGRYAWDGEEPVRN